MSLLRCVVLAGLALAPTIVTASTFPCTDYESQTHWVGRLPHGSWGGSTHHALVHPPYAYVLIRVDEYENTVLATVDVSNPQQPVVIGSTNAGGPGRTARSDSGQHVFVVNHGSLWVVDVSDLASPGVVGTLVVPGGFSEDVQVSGDWVYVASAGVVYVIDASKPTSPFVDHALTSLAEVEAITVSGELLFAAEGAAGVELFDVSTPASPTPLGWVDTPDNALRVFVDGGTAYVADEHSGIQIVDSCDPSNPQIIGTVPETPPYQVHDVAVADGYAYVPGRWIADVSDPTAPAIVATMSSGGWAAPTIADGYAYYAGGWLYVSRLGTPGEPAQNVLPFPWSLSSVNVSGTRAYVTSYDGYQPGVADLTIVDLADPDVPSILGQLETPDRFNDVDVGGAYAYGVHDTGLHVVDVSEPSAPVITGSLTLPRANDILVSNGLAYLAESQNFRIVDVSDPSSPAIRSTLALTSSQLLRLDKSGDYVFIAAGAPTPVQIVDVSDPDAPRLAAVVDAPFSGNALAVDGDHLWFGALHVADISNPEAPVVLASRQMISNIYDIVIAGNIAYCGSAVSGIHMVDIRDPAALRLVGGIDAPERPRSLAVGNERLWITYVDSGLPEGLYNAPLPCAAALASDPSPAPFVEGGFSFPNPFRESTKLSFALRRAGRATLGIFDVHGRRVWNTEWQATAPGSQDVTWDGRDRKGRPVPGGVYFYEFRSAGARQRGKLTVVR